MQGSDRKKNPKAEYVDSLRMHAHDMFGSHGITSGHAFFRGQLGAASSDAKAQGQHGQPQEGGDDESADETPNKSRHELAPQKRDRVSVVQLEDSEDELENPIRGGGASSRKKKRKVNVADATVSLYEAVGSSLCEHRLGLSSRQRRGTAPCVVSHVRASRSLGPLARPPFIKHFPSDGKRATLNSSIPLILMLLATACDCSAEVANAELIAHLLLFSFVPKATSD